MDDSEDYLALFFTECGELLGDLQEQLDRLMDGDRDPELVNAAFRAVHSVKGGAAAFGFDALIGFAHVFETVMDGLRSGRLALNSEVVNLLMRAGDIMEVLIEQARDGAQVDEGAVARVRQELEEMTGRSSAEETEDDAPVAAAAPAPVEPEPAELEPREVTVSIRLHDDFVNAGHDPLRMIRAAREFDLVAAEPFGDLPPLEELTSEGCPLGWRLRFETDRPTAELRDFFLVYEHIAELAFEDPWIDNPPATAPAAGAGPEAAPAAAAPAAPEPDAPAPAAAAPSAPSGGGEGKEGGRHGPSKTLRVELTRIDRLVNLVGEIVITQAVLAQKLSETDAHTALEVGHSVEAMSRQTRELQESVMAIRAQPVKSVFSRMPRVVRDLAEKLDKEARLVLAGEHTEVDTTVIEELAEPLTHMLRNSMDHGLEGPDEREQLGKPRTGTIRLAAEHRGERVIIIVEDDGRGVNRERVMEKAIENGLIGPEDNLPPEEIDQLIFHPGFSTAKEISSVSGRGVGMDVVKKKIQALGGRIHMRSDPGKGTRFQITLPLTLAVLDGMTVCVGDERFILPLSSVVEALRIEGERVEMLPDRSQVLARRGEYLRLISLRDTLGIGLGEKREEMAIVVDTETRGLVALLVDELIGQRQVVLKSLEANFQRVEGVSGATILGDGRVALILDVPSLVSMGGLARAPMQETFH
ncbi:chemotaxis protein CheA [Albimonas sp. CAU 1670]|uniref:chemotaxis protein CheA n=1 Tax=Albimonas sp. CAU 1670 TaxID=3032599 RepID=UPI0023DBC785|nr:chemotaxis protein CheA [Albimonas sp. CAU 1670]MDF2231127.1 chemotaxis protein CheA [Albimonas sp. CAU 1670]